MKRRRLTLTLAAALAFLLGFLISLKSAPAEERFDLKVRSDFFAGYAGNPEALKRGMLASEDALKQNPKNAETLVWHGSGLYFQGGQAYAHGDSDKGLDLVMKGMSEMDEAVEMEPANVAVRIPRGAAMLQSTLYIQDEQIANPLIEKGLADYEKTLELQKDQFTALGEHSRGELLFGIADGYRRLGNEAKAKAMFERIAAELPGSSDQKRAEIWLTTKTLTIAQARCSGCHAPAK